MKNRLQGLIVGLLIGGIISSGIVLAKQATQTAELIYDNIKITLNGNEIIPKDANGNYVEPFTINGTTYLPVRAVAGALGINVDWDDTANTVVLSDQNSGNPATGFGESIVSNEISVVKEYLWKTDYSNYIAIILKNNSSNVISPRIQISYKDSYGKVVGADDDSEDAFGPGSEMAFVFSNDEAFESYEYIVSASDETYYDECVSKLEVSHSTTPNKAIIQVRNTGDKAATSVKYTVLFKKDGEVVDPDWGYCVDTDSEIKPGMTEMAECSVAYNVEFDTVEVYLTAIAYKE